MAVSYALEELPAPYLSPHLYQIVVRVRLEITRVAVGPFHAPGVPRDTSHQRSIP